METEKIPVRRSTSLLAGGSYDCRAISDARSGKGNEEPLWCIPSRRID